jgi:hypothetical protein
MGIVVAILLGGAVLAGYTAGRYAPGAIASTARTTFTAGVTTTVTAPTTVTTTQSVTTTQGIQSQNQACITNINSPPQAQYVSLLHQIMKNSLFISYSNGRCWTWDSTFELTSGGTSSTNFVFEHYSSEIIYPCGWFPAHVIDAEVFVIPVVVNGTLTGVTIVPQAITNTYFCPASRPIVSPVSFKLISWNSSGQTVALTVELDSNVSARSLTAFFFTSSWNYTMHFTKINSTNPLLPGSRVTQTDFIPGTQVAGDIQYGLTASGIYVNGTPFSSDVHVELQI